MKSILCQTMVIGSMLFPMVSQATESTTSEKITEAVARVVYACKSDGQGSKRAVDQIDLQTSSGAVLKVNSVDLVINQKNQITISDKVIGTISDVKPDLNCEAQDGSQKFVSYKVRMLSGLVVSTGQYEDSFCDGGSAHSGLFSGAREAVQVKSLVDSSLQNQKVMDVASQSSYKRCFSLKTVFNDSIEKAASVVLLVPAVGADFTYYFFTKKHLFEQPGTIRK